MTLAFVLGLFVFYFNLKKIGYKFEALIDFALIFSISGVVGSRILYIVLYPYQFHSIRDYLAIYEGGMVFYGGLLLAFINSVIYIKIKKIHFATVFDSVVPALALGHSIGRLGCYSNGCCYGCVTDLIKFYHLPQDPAGVYRHPTQLYSSLFLFFLFIVLEILFLRCYNKKRFSVKGFVGGIYLLSYAVFRFLIEFIRGDDRGGFFTVFHLSISQCVSVILFLSALIWLVYVIIIHRRETDKMHIDNRGPK